MDQERFSTKPEGRGWGRALKGCAIIAGVVCVALIALLVYMMRIPAVQGMVACRQNMVDVGDALQRYRGVTGVYPPSIEVLGNDYLTDLAVLRCPDDKGFGPVSGYVYHMPAADAPDGFVVLECKGHRIAEGSGTITLRLHLGGDISLVTNSHPKSAAK